MQLLHDSSKLCRVGVLRGIQTLDSMRVLVQVRGQAGLQLSDGGGDVPVGAARGGCR
jgi:hypothetical protein